MERSIEYYRVTRATNESLYYDVVSWTPGYTVTEHEVKLSKPMTDEELRALFSNGRPNVEVYYEDKVVVAIRKNTTW